MEVHADKALALDFVFSKFWLPQGGKFFIFNPLTKEAIGGITSQFLSGDKTDPKRFSTGIVKGDNIILEYYQPVGVKELPVIKVEKAYYTYIPAPAFNGYYLCDYEVNVNCDEGSNWQLEKDAIALVYRKFTQGGAWCSGALVNNTQFNKAPLFLTANHCLKYDNTNYGGYLEVKDYYGDNDLSDWVFYWGYELPSCLGYIQPSYNKTTIGATIIANDSLFSDFALLQLQQDPIYLSDYSPFYLGWDATGNSGTGGVCIHHPRHDVKKISTYTCTPQTSSYKSFPPVYWRVQWISTANGHHGITEPGSSGSPLFNNNHRVIGQLRGGDASCEDLTDPDYFGKLNISWTGNGTFDSHRRLKDWLDPDNSNTLILDGISSIPPTISGSSYICSSSTGIYPINYLPHNYTIDWYLSNGFGSSVPIMSSSGDTCTIINNLSGSYAGILNADVYYNGTLLTTLQKEIIIYSGFYGVVFYNGSNNNSQQFYPSTPIWVTKGSSVHLKSPNLINKNVSYSVTTPSWWQYDSTTGDIYVTYPNVIANNPILISVQHNSNYSNCDNSYQIVIMPNNVLPRYSLNTSISDNKQIQVSLIETEYNDEANSVLETYTKRSIRLDNWTLEVYNATTSNKIYSKVISEKTYTINSSGWKSGVYIIKAVIGDQELSEKVVIK